MTDLPPARPGAALDLPLRLACIGLCVLAGINLARLILTVPSGEKLGAPCSSSADCAHGGCLTLGVLSHCSMKCQDASECGDGFACLRVAGDRYCVRERAPGQECSVSADCNSHSCLIRPTTYPTQLGTCARFCDEDEDCPEGLHCNRNEAGEDVCLPGKVDGRDGLAMPRP